MKKGIILVMIGLISQLGFTQELIQLDYSDFENSLLMKKNKLDDFKYLVTKAEVGVAYVKQNDIKTYNTENGIKLIRVTSSDIKELNTSFSFSRSIEMIIIDVLKPNFNIDDINCTKLKQFKNLKYIYYRYKTGIKNNSELQKTSCLPINIRQYYTKLLDL